MSFEPYGLVMLPLAPTVDDGATGKVRDDVKQKLRERRYAIFVANTRSGVIYASAAAALLVAQFVTKTPAPVLVGWSICFVVIMLARIVLVRYYDRTENKAFLAPAFTILIFAYGSIWGLSALLFPPSDSLLDLAIIALWTGALVAAATAAFALVLPVFFAFSIPAIAPVAAVYLTSGDGTGITIGIALLVMYCFMISVALHTHQFVTEALKLEFQNEQLIHDLDEEKRQVEELNEILRTDILEREQTEIQLRGAKDEAERLTEKLILISSLDGLTEIANRRQFDEALSSEWARAVREATPLALIMLDIDYFKAYNDRYGHQAGDECLKIIAHVLEGFCRRGGDLAARYGGEEFVLLLPGTRLPSALSVAKSIKEELEALKLEHKASPVAAIVSSSFGVTSMVPRRELKADLLVEIADKALYRAKNSGRNRIESGAPVGVVDHTEKNL